MLVIVMGVILTAAAVKAALGTLSRPMAGVGVAPSLRRRGVLLPLEGIDDDWKLDTLQGGDAIDYEDLL